MDKFIFKHIREDTKVIHSIDNVASWTDLFQEFRTFLMGCGYQIPQIDIVEHNEEETDT